MAAQVQKQGKSLKVFMQKLWEYVITTAINNDILYQQVSNANMFYIDRLWLQIALLD